MSARVSVDPVSGRHCGVSSQNEAPVGLINAELR